MHLVNALGPFSALPHGVSLRRILQTLAKSAKELGAFKLARHAFDRLHALVLPEAEREAIEAEMLSVQAKPMSDKAELLPVCFLSGQTNPLLNPASTGDVYPSCGHAVVRSLVNFELLPLVEFVPAPGISDDEAIELIRTDVPKKRSNWEREDEADLFHEAINRALAIFEEKSTFAPVVCDAACLLSLRREEIFCLRPRLEIALAGSETAMPPGQAVHSPELGRGVHFCRFFRNMLSDGSCPVAVSQAAGAFFVEEDLELALLRDSACPFSRTPAANITEYGSV